MIKRSQCRQSGFTLIEIVIAFTILAMGSILAVNVIAQNTIRVSKVNQHLILMNTLESAIAIVRSEISQNNIKNQYRGQAAGGYQWLATVEPQLDQEPAQQKQYLKLYTLNFQVFHEKEKQQFSLKTILANH